MVCSLELGGNLTSGAKVDLVGRLAAKRRVRHHRVEMLHVEGDQSLHTVEAIEHMQVQPLVA